MRDNTEISNVVEVHGLNIDWREGENRRELLLPRRRGDAEQTELRKFFFLKRRNCGNRRTQLRFTKIKKGAVAPLLLAPRPRAFAAIAVLPSSEVSPYLAGGGGGGGGGGVDGSVRGDGSPRSTGAGGGGGGGGGGAG